MNLKKPLNVILLLIGAALIAGCAGMGYEQTDYMACFALSGQSKGEYGAPAFFAS